METMPGTADDAPWALPSAGKVGMFALIGAESAIFVIFITAYAFYLGKSVSGPTPDILSPPVFLSVCLLSSSATIELAIKNLKRGNARAFAALWFVTGALGVTFLVGTGLEWRHLMVDEGLRITTNLFGTTYYSLVGLHGFHVTVGVLVMSLVAAFAGLGKVTPDHEFKLEVLSLYWHFVDVVWVVVFTLVYVVGR
jgi:cytochrome c oxidase subunit 3